MKKVLCKSEIGNEIWSSGVEVTDDVVDAYLVYLIEYAASGDPVWSLLGPAHLRRCDAWGAVPSPTRGLSTAQTQYESRNPERYANVISVAKRSGDAIL